MFPQLLIPANTLRFYLTVAVTLACGVGVSACTTTHKPPRPEQLANLSYQGIYDTPVTLSDGVYEGAPFVPGGASRPRVELIEHSFVTGNLGGDGAAEAVVLLSASTGGSGTQIYLAVTARGNDQLRNIATQRIGDRVQIRALRIEQQAIVLELIVAGPTDGACCPRQKLRNSYRLEGGQLVQAASVQLGTLGIADLNGAGKVMQLDRNDAVPDDVTVSVTFSDGKISGAAGCNRYFGAVKGKDPYDLSVGPVGATRMACPEPVMAIEDRFLRALEGVRQFGFLMGKVALTWEVGQVMGTMLLAPASDSAQKDKKKPPGGG
ncbi:MAG: META domain-containing protein [Pseudomonadota bacterium]|nr:MAG: META domain-containing protein [Pseudomonadota bacterium]